MFANKNNAIVNFDNYNVSNFFGESGNFIQNTISGNTIGAKIAFVIIILIIFLILLRLASSILVWLYSPDNDPILIKGRVNAKRMLVYSQDPNKKNSVPILRSKNEFQGTSRASSKDIHPV